MKLKDKNKHKSDFKKKLDEFAGKLKNTFPLKMATGL